MGENQTVDGHLWNTRLNQFLSVLGWRQLGDSRIDIIGIDGKKRGVDSVFYYEDPLRNGNHEGFFIEAKRYSWDNATPSEIQKWCNELLDSLERLPRSPDFLDKYSPPESTRFISGIIAIWHHDKYRHDAFMQRLEQLESYRRRQHKNIFVISNWIILRLSAMLSEVYRLRSEQSVKEVQFFFPHRATPKPVQGLVIPVEYLFSKYSFVTLRRLVTKDDITRPIEEKLVFYYGGLDRKSLEFVHNVTNEIQIANNPVIVYCSEDVHLHRSSIEDFKRTYRHYEIRQLNVGSDIPEWVSRES